MLPVQLLFFFLHGIILNIQLNRHFRRCKKVKFYSKCVSCLMEIRMRKLDGIKDERLKLEYVQKMCEIFAAIDAETEAPPIADSRLIRLQRDLLHIEDDYSAIKHSFNQLLLGIYPRLKERVDAAADPLCAAIQLSMAGNYIDFGVLKDVQEEQLLSLLDEAAGKRVDPVEYAHLVEDLQKPGELLFIHDNCGEIVLDKLLLETIHRLYPEKKLVSMVRMVPVINDVTREDAAEVGLDSFVEVIDNGLPDVAGTVLHLMPESACARIRNAGMVIAKGQGNFETLQASGMNIYFLFLAKCAGYKSWFGFDQFSGVLANDLRMQVCV